MLSTDSEYGSHLRFLYGERDRPRLAPVDGESVRFEWALGGGIRYQPIAREFSLEGGKNTSGIYLGASHIQTSS